MPQAITIEAGKSVREFPDAKAAVLWLLEQPELVELEWLQDLKRDELQKIQTRRRKAERKLEYTPV